MKYFTQLITLAIAVLLFASCTTANPVADLAPREPEAEAEAAPVLVGDAGLSAAVHLEKRKKKSGSSSSSGNKTSDAIPLTPGSAVGVAGLAVIALMT